MKTSTWAWTVLIAVGLVLLGISLMIPGLSGSQRASNDRNASASLKTVATAQADFRSNDRDGNHENDYWRGDIAGLYTIVPKGGSPKDAIKLIEPAIACADDRPVTDIHPYGPRRPKAGYWYRALRFKSETTPGPNRFAACAYPDTLSSGRVMFLITDRNQMYMKSVDRIEPPVVCPDDPEKEGWRRMD